MVTVYRLGVEAGELAYDDVVLGPYKFARVAMAKKEAIERKLRRRGIADLQVHVGRIHSGATSAKAAIERLEVEEG